MSDKKIVTITIKEAKKRPDHNGTNKTTNKPYTVYSWDCSADVAGEDRIIRVKTMMQSNVALVVTGASLSVEEQEFNGQTEYFIPMQQRSGGFGGGGGFGKREWKPDPAREASIMRQCVFKGAVDLVCHDKIELKHMEEFINKYCVILGTTPAKQGDDAPIPF